LKIPTFLLDDTIVIRRFLGAGGEADVYEDPGSTVRARVEARRRLVRTQDGDSTTLADATAYIRPEVAAVPIGSVVNWGGVEYRVAGAGAIPTEVHPTYRELLLEAQ
jgi:hypothetical protein